MTATGLGERVQAQSKGGPSRERDLSELETNTHAKETFSALLWVNGRVGRLALGGFLRLEDGLRGGDTAREQCRHRPKRGSLPDG